MKYAAEEIFKDFTLGGIWWVPSDPNGAGNGTLSYSNDRIRLRLDRPIVSELGTAWSIGSVKIPVILGRANDGSDVTILRAFYWDSRDNEIDLLANEIVVGAHIDESSAVIWEIVVKFTNLEEWTASHLVTQSIIGEDKNLTLVASTLPEPNLQITDLPQFKRLALSTDLHLSQTSIETKLTNQTRFNIEFSKGVGLQTVIGSIRSLGNLLALLIDDPVQPTHIKLTIRREPSGPDISANYAIPTRVSQPKQKNEFEMRLPFRDLEQTNLAEVLFRNWFEREEELRPVCDLLLSTVYSPGQYVQSTFLSLAQAVESFHRRVYGGTYVSEKEYSLIKQALIDAIPEGTDEAFSAKLTGTLGYGNELSLRSRLEFLFRSVQLEHFVSLSGNDDPRKFVQLLLNLRNYLTHYKGRKPEILESVVDLYNLNRRIAALLMLMVFKHLGLPENFIFVPVKGRLRLF